MSWINKFIEKNPFYTGTMNAWYPGLDYLQEESYFYSSGLTYKYSPVHWYWKKNQENLELVLWYVIPKTGGYFGSTFLFDSERSALSIERTLKLRGKEMADSIFPILNRQSLEIKIDELLSKGFSAHSWFKDAWNSFLAGNEDMGSLLGISLREEPGWVKPSSLLCKKTPGWDSCLYLDCFGFLEPDCYNEIFDVWMDPNNGRVYFWAAHPRFGVCRLWVKREISWAEISPLIHILKVARSRTLKRFLLQPEDSILHDEDVDPDPLQTLADLYG